MGDTLVYRKIYLSVRVCRFLTGCRALPLPEREVPSQNPFFLSFCAARGGTKRKLTK
jgi:hypothetical protein